MDTTQNSNPSYEGPEMKLAKLHALTLERIAYLNARIEFLECASFDYNFSIPFIRKTLRLNKELFTRVEKELKWH